MFGRENVYATVAGFNVRVKDEREQDKNHLVEATFEVPLTYEVLDEISPAIARDLFDTVKGEHVPKPELNDAGLNLNPETQLMVLRNHPELDPEVKIAGVTLRKIRAKKAEANTWLLVFTATWTLGDRKEVTTIIDRLKQGVYLTTTTQEPKLDLQGDGAATAGDGDGQVAQVDGTGNVTSITEGKKRRGRRKKTDTPEAIAADQEAAARDQLPDPDGQPSTEGDPPEGSAEDVEAHPWKAGDESDSGPVH